LWSWPAPSCSSFQQKEPAFIFGSNFRVVVKKGSTEIHYATTKGAGRSCGSQITAIDKVYTEAFTDSDGVAHWKSFGAVLTDYGDKPSVTGKARNKLYGLEKKHRKDGRFAKADHIKLCNLGRIKIDARKDRTHKRLRTIAYQAAHTIVDKATGVVSEDLTSPIARKQVWKR
jgi:hypothetical protein